MQKMNILIAGGSGLVGKSLSMALQKAGHAVSWLSRTAGDYNGIKAYQWDIHKAEIQLEAVKNADAIINLTGAGVADQKWTRQRKDEIFNSRIQSVKLLSSALQNAEHHVHTFISASAIGYYGWDTGDEIVDENSPKGSGFLADVVDEWEKEVTQINQSGVRTTILRLGIVLSMKGGALPKHVMPARFGLAAALGGGNQYMSWIHIDDLTSMFNFILSNIQLSGIYNAVAPEPVTNEKLTKKIAAEISRPYFLPNVPSFLLKVGLGEMSQMLLGGNKVSCTKIIKEGFNFRYTMVEDALHKLLR